MRFFILLRKYFRKIIFIINCITVVLLLLSYLSAYISPVEFYGFAFLGLIYPFLLFANIIFIVVWLTFKSKYFLISTIAILCGWNYLTSFIQFNFTKKDFSFDEQEIRILSYNVRVFNRWNWSDEKNSGTKVIEFIRDAKADIVCLQEFYSDSEKGINSVDSILKNSSLTNVHTSYAKKNNKTFHHGLATFSSYPIINKGDVKLKDEENFCIFTDILVDDDTIRVYNLHLESIHLGYADYHLIENINNTDTINVKGIRSILSKFKRGYKKRAYQANIIAENIKFCKYPIIICGDFNDTPVSYAYKKLTGNLLDAFCESGNGIGSTYINKYSTFRIDFILHSDDICSFNFEIPQIKLSDHYPVQCSMQKRKKEIITN